jgi:hypothetical protein
MSPYGEITGEEFCQVVEKDDTGALASPVRQHRFAKPVVDHEARREGSFAECLVHRHIYVEELDPGHRPTRGVTYERGGKARPDANDTTGDTLLTELQPAGFQFRGEASDAREYGLGVLSTRERCHGGRIGRCCEILWLCGAEVQEQRVSRLRKTFYWHETRREGEEGTGLAHTSQTRLPIRFLHSLDRLRAPGPA